MSNLHEHDPLGRFSGPSEHYDSRRPDYPPEAIDFIVAGLGTDSLLVDVGSGTGISSRLVAARGVPVLGIEPNDAMRSRAELHGTPGVRYLPGRAEATGLDDAVADAVLSAQAFHWFEPTAALREMRRILKPGGKVFLMWYERDESDFCTREYGDLVRTAPDAETMERGRIAAGEHLHRSPDFERTGRIVFGHRRRHDLQALIERTFTISYAPREPQAVQHWHGELTRLFERHSEGGNVELRYEYTIHFGSSITQNPKPSVALMP